MATKTNYAQRAAMLCQDKQFWLWLDRRQQIKFKNNVPDGTHTLQDAIDFVRKVCCIQSRKELDTNPAAAQELFKLQSIFNKWKRGQGEG